jgi:hypothetical protein
MMAQPERFGALTAGIATADRTGNRDEADRLRTELRTAKLAAKIREATAAAPPLTEGQLDRLRGLLGAT